MVLEGSFCQGTMRQLEAPPPFPIVVCLLNGRDNLQGPLFPFYLCGQIPGNSPVGGQCSPGGKEDMGLPLGAACFA